MAKQTVGRTALGAAICRLIEQYQPEGTRLFNDQVVKELVSKPVRFLMQFASIRNFTVKQTDAVMKGLYGAQVCRTRYIDDAVQAALSQGIGQLVILGAGLDTRPYRLPGLEHLKVFEVDLPMVQDNKREKIVKHLGRLPSMSHSSRSTLMRRVWKPFLPGQHSTLPNRLCLFGKVSPNISRKKPFVGRWHSSEHQQMEAALCSPTFCEVSSSGVQISRVRTI
jgi:O-methyltransferase involved in polyketide biosynthesis